MYVHAIYIYIYSCTCTYIYIHVYDFMKLSEHVHTCLYNVQTRMYCVAQSCPGGQDSRCMPCSSTQAVTNKVCTVTRNLNAGAPRGARAWHRCFLGMSSRTCGHQGAASHWERITVPCAPHHDSARCCRIWMLLCNANRYVEWRPR